MAETSDVGLLPRTYFKMPRVPFDFRAVALAVVGVLVYQAGGWLISKIWTDNRLDIPGALAVAPPSKDPHEPNEDVSHVKANGLFRRAATPLTAAGRKSGAVSARLDSGEDPRDLYRVWIPGRRAASIALQPSVGDVDLSAWGPRTRSVFESGTARKRDFRGLSERTGTKRERLRVRNRAKKGAYFYVEASVGAGGGSAVRKVAGLRYKLSVSIVNAARR